jgi:hypothetical protein
VPDGEEEAAGVCLRQPDGVVAGEVFGGADPGGVRDQVARVKERMAAELAQAWRPYRTWVVLLLRVLLEPETGEIRGTRARGVTGRPGT